MIISGFTLYRSQIYQLFDYIDKDKSGRINRKELIHFFDEGFLKSGSELDARDLLRYCIHRLAIQRNGTIDLRSVFNRFDTNHNGSLSPNEFKDALKQLGIVLSDKRFNELMQLLPHNSKNNILINDFIDYYKGSLDKASRDEIETLVRKKIEKLRVSGDYKSVFRRFDKDKSGSITKNEFLKMTKDVGVPMNEADIKYIYFIYT